MDKQLIIRLFWLFFGVFSYEGFAQSPVLEWQKTFGGSNGDIAYEINQTNDGGYIFISSTASSDIDVTNFHGIRDIWVVKTSLSGTIEWQKALGGSEIELGISIQQTTDGGYILVGYTNSTDGDITEFHEGFCSWVVKLSSVGDIEWQKIYIINDYNQAKAIRQTIDGGYIVAGTNYSFLGDPEGTGNHGGEDFWVMKISASGEVEWQKSLGGTLYDSAQDIQQTSEGDYIVIGVTTSNDGDVTSNHGQADYWVVKLSGVGNIVWQKTFGGSNYDNPISVCLTTDGGCVVTGRVQSSDYDVTGFHGGGVDAWILKLNSEGGLEWQKALGGSSLDVLFDIDQTSLGDFIAVGFTSSNDGDVSGYHFGTASAGDCWAVKLSGNGNVIWQKCLGGSSSDAGNRVSLTADGGCIISGSTNSYDGDVSMLYGNEDSWIVKLAPDVLSATNFIIREIEVIPNPVESIVRLQTHDGEIIETVSIFDLSGKEILKLTAQDNQIDISQLATGTYLLEAISDKEKFRAKLLKK